MSGRSPPLYGTPIFLFVALCCFRFCFCFQFLCSRCSFIDVPLIFSCRADHVPDWNPRILLGMVEARAVNVTYAHTQVSLIPPWEDQCEWHRMTRMTGPDCAVVCNLIHTLSGEK